MLAFRCAHPLQTRPGACLLLENARSRKGCLMCSHVWCVSGKVSGMVVLAEEKKGVHNRRAAYGKGPWVSNLS